ncbi:MAG: phasin family protein [Thermoanaerobaculia bacterium]|jgi:poly(hydroxyalkanoate) granule-associated protein
MTKKSKTDVQNEVAQSAQKIWLAGIGALATAEEEGSKLFNSLVKKGEGYEAQGKQRVGDVRARVEQIVGQAEGSMERLGNALDEKVADAIKRLGVPSRDEIAQLTKSVEELTVKVDSLKATSRQPQAKAAPKKAQAKKTKTSKAN